MAYAYKTKGTCATQIELELEGNIVRSVKFTGGCNGNLQAIPKLVEGLTVEQVEEKIGGISCGGRRRPAAISWREPAARLTRHPSRPDVPKKGEGKMCGQPAISIQF